MKTTLSILALLFGLSLTAQTFNRTLALNGDESPAYNLVEANGYYYVLIAQPSNNLSVLYQLDSLGGIHDSLSLNSRYAHLYYLNNSLYLFGGADSVISIAKVSPSKLSVNNNKLTKLNNIINNIFFREVKYFDKCTCFTLVGGGVDTSGYSRASLVQLDTTSLNVLRESHYTHWPVPLQSSAATNFIFDDIFDDITNNGFWVIASSPTQTFWQSMTAAVIPISSRDLAIDTTNFRHLYDVNNPSPFVNIDYHGILSNQPTSGVRLTDSTNLFLGRTELTKGNIQTVFWTERDIAYVITDIDLNDIRWEFWGGQAGGVSHSSPDSTEFPAIGKAISKHGDYAYIAYSSTFFASTSSFTLRKIDLQGNEIWTKFYSVSPGPATTVYSVLATSDGGALISGQVVDLINFETNVHVMKVDSSGNLLTTFSKNEFGKIAAENYQVYPNPANGEINLLKVNQFKPYEFELYDTFGRLVKSVSWRADYRTVDVSSIAAGVYVYRIIDEQGNVGSGKLIME